MLRNNQTKVSETLQSELAAYGIVRMEVMENAKPKKSGEPSFFGLREGYRETELKFDATPEQIQKAGMTLALAAPEDASFDMIAVTNFDKAMKAGTVDEKKDWLRKIVDEA
jgi:hypothetical protein